MTTPEDKYRQNIESGKLPGVCIAAGDADGNVLREFWGGKQTLAPGRDRPWTTDTLCNLASCSKIMTIIAILQCVEDKVLDLDESVFKLVPEVAQQGIIDHWDDEKGELVTRPNTKDITLRMLLTHSCGYELDFANETLQKWRKSRGEMPYGGANVVEKCSIPLATEPGTQWNYGAGIDWAGLMVERATGESLETLMRRRVWGPLGIVDATFFPHVPGMKHRIAEMCTLSPDRKGPAQVIPGFDPVVGAKECIGGSGIYSNVASMLKFLAAVLRRDKRLLTETSWEELFRPQFGPDLEEALNTHVMPQMDGRRPSDAWGLPKDLRVNWSLAGLYCNTAEDGRLREGTVCWGGVPGMQWYVDAKSGLCGIALMHLLPPFDPEIVSIHRDFHRQVYKDFVTDKGKD